MQLYSDTYDDIRLYTLCLSLAGSKSALVSEDLVLTTLFVKFAQVFRGLPRSSEALFTLV